jgi:hypothetical protein
MLIKTSLGSFHDYENVPMIFAVKDRVCVFAGCHKVSAIVKRTADCQGLVKAAVKKTSDRFLQGKEIGKHKLAAGGVL